MTQAQIDKYKRDKFNPPAFRSAAGYGVESSPGMDLRDYFAAAAIQGLVGCLAFDGEAADPVPSGKFARWAYAIADAMLRERAKEQPTP